MCGCLVLFKISLSAPRLDESQMIGAACLLQYVVAQDAGILRAVHTQLLDGGKALIFFRANEIDMRQDIDGARAGYRGLADHEASVQTLINRRCEKGLELFTQLRGTRRSRVARLRL